MIETKFKNCTNNQIVCYNNKQCLWRSEETQVSRSNRELPVRKIRTAYTGVKRPVNGFAGTSVSISAGLCASGIPSQTDSAALQF